MLFCILPIPALHTYENHADTLVYVYRFPEIKHPYSLSCVLLLTSLFAYNTYYEPILMGAAIFLISATALNGAVSDVFGFFEGFEATSAENSPNSPFTIILCTFLVTDGSAMIVTLVLSAPIPAKLKVAEMFTFFGNCFTASFAFP